MAKPEEITNLALRKNLFYPAAEIYANAPAGFWEFGPLGNRIHKNVAAFWRRELLEREGFLEIDGAQILPEPVFEASTHLSNFNDPIAQCLKCHSLHRVDHMLSEASGDLVPESMSTDELDALMERHAVKCPKCGKKAFSKAKKFNMMMGIDIGATGDVRAYLRPETCQSIFLDFNRIVKVARQNLPIGIAQLGKSFRNEIAPRQTLLRAREFYQMEVEIFFNPKKVDEAPRFADVEKEKLPVQLEDEDAPKERTSAQLVEQKLVSGKFIAYYLARLYQFYRKMGIPKENIRFRALGEDEKAFYAKEAFDFEVKTDLGWIELVACNYRTDFDLGGHAKVSKKDLTVSEDGDPHPFIPHVFELSSGLDRTFYVLLLLSHRTDKQGKEERDYLDLHPRIAPYLAGIFPLVKKDGLLELAQKIHEDVASHGIAAVFDEKGSIGRRYRRVDELGVPFAVTVDHQTTEDGTVTIRERNTLSQKRVKAADLPEMLWKLGNEKVAFEKL